MKRTLEARLAKLEAAHGAGAQIRQAHRVIVQPGEDAEAHIAALIASGRAAQSDRFIVRQIVGRAS